MTPAHIDDRELLAGLADGSLPAARFDHENHVRVAWLCLRDADGRAAGEARFCNLLRTYVAGLGASDKYHHTLSVALLRLIDARRRVRPELDWPAFAALHRELFVDARGLLARHYSAARLNSAAARREFVDADGEPLP
ncbi:hypothetical protein [Solimonas terrae]|uniref:Uncharacterized protein n=1 Tax=Solimonas terrae TaxID=1396819 RepID=A0A6M2BQW7_9GAMM|nr:hypothetical protein [Solimonas terrae]NGY05032.1 hypothetical protein [Solimonas terrae]